MFWRTLFFLRFNNWTKANDKHCGGKKEKNNNTIPSSCHRTGVTSLFNPCSLVWWDSLYTNNLLQQPPDNLGAVKHDLKNASEYNSRWDNIFQHVTLTLHHWKKKKKQHNMKTRSLEVSSDGSWFTWRARTAKEKKKGQSAVDNFIILNYFPGTLRSLKAARFSHISKTMHDIFLFNLRHVCSQLLWVKSFWLRQFKTEVFAKWFIAAVVQEEVLEQINCPPPSNNARD